MKPKVVVYRPVPADLLQELQQTCEVKYFPKWEDPRDPLFVAELKTAHGLLGSGLPINQELLEQAPLLKIVSNISVGYDNLDLAELRQRNIWATNTPGVLDETTADAIFALVLAAARRIPELDSYMKAGHWREMIGEELFGVDVHHKTLGIIGMGNIGKAIAKRAHFGFDMPILYHNRSRNQEAERDFQAVYCELDELLGKADFVCLMTPHTPETDKLMGEREFGLMKKTAIFINGSRGKNVDEQALIKALQNNWIRGAGLDVYEQEPIDPTHPLLTMPNVVTVPHIGSATQETRYQMARLAVDNLLKGINGLTPPNLITA
ncbi:2-hydroxyacid dehydrogenase [Brevibacillus fulvus]|uniref:Gluconate 2-dehydrogenase n=1 Tax=Brevibacillus fulvus TaxID=1125967 RepID=A0A938XZ47_9BACL|nr:D-glycerate dehydrogenase [Brevibacillus fulvus]MBM7590456.1 gluconate 2-dehydrogenase [Brevibacillus fulvus]